MLRFGLCDTDTQFLSKLADALHKMFDPCRIEYMYGPLALEVYLQSDNAADVDVLITEIELRQQNAIDLISRCMEESCATQVVFMTSKIEFCTEVYEARHCGLLLKPVRIEDLERNVKRALTRLKQTKESGILVQKNGTAHVVRASSLIYVEGRGRIIKVQTDSETLESYEKVADFIYRLDGRFLQCHKSYVVNMDRVNKFQGDSFLMDNGAIVPISQSRRKDVRELFLKYMGNALAHS